MDAVQNAKNYQAKIDRITAGYVSQLVKAGHVPSQITNHLIQDFTKVVDGYIQAEPKINSKEQ